MVKTLASGAIAGGTVIIDTAVTEARGAVTEAMGATRVAVFVGGTKIEICPVRLVASGVAETFGSDPVDVVFGRGSRLAPAPFAA